MKGCPPSEKMRSCSLSESQTFVSVLGLPVIYPLSKLHSITNLSTNLKNPPDNTFGSIDSWVWSRIKQPFHLPGADVFMTQPTSQLISSQQASSNGVAMPN
ncbi:hypothetical protein NPIL_695541 [Nephila pilipes]|uniref:Uncharacterized protein n=1 Tax=Nephila pilipes TaxID=299642 RepID=A0A8X6NVH9_NEPPI|nr:hypothetical protein NPIL_695541 [Nephila pilipes]